ncbi:MAG: alpha-glucosidase/alpha-galactosidase, partial [Actinomycetes bacterium]
SHSQSGAARIYVTTPNRGWIENVHQDNAVEVAAIVDSEGIHPQKYGRLPEHMASWVRRHQEFNDLAVTSILEQNREAAVHALMLDPLTSAASELGKIREMFDEMVSAQRAFLPAYLH